MSEKNFGRGRPRGPGSDEARARSARSFLATILCLVGVLLALVGFVVPFVAGAALVADISLQAIGVLLGVLGYFMGAGRLALATILLCFLSIFFGLAASQGLVPGVEGYDRGLPDEEPAASPE